MIITINTQTKKVDKKPQAGDEKLTKAEETTVFAEAIAAATVGMTFERFKKPVARVSFIGVLMKMIFSALQHLEDEEAEKVDREKELLKKIFGDEELEVEKDEPTSNV